jgi:hypothetical protein
MASVLIDAVFDQGLVTYEYVAMKVGRGRFSEHSACKIQKFRTR